MFRILIFLTPTKLNYIFLGNTMILTTIALWPKADIYLYHGPVYQPNTRQYEFRYPSKSSANIPLNSFAFIHHGARVKNKYIFEYWAEIVGLIPMTHDMEFCASCGENGYRGDYRTVERRRLYRVQLNMVNGEIYYVHLCLPCRRDLGQTRTQQYKKLIFALWALRQHCDILDINYHILRNLVKK